MATANAKKANEMTTATRTKMEREKTWKKEKNRRVYDFASIGKAQKVLGSTTAQCFERRLEL